MDVDGARIEDSFARLPLNHTIKERALEAQIAALEAQIAAVKRSTAGSSSWQTVADSRLDSIEGDVRQSSATIGIHV